MRLTLVASMIAVGLIACNNDSSVVGSPLDAGAGGHDATPDALFDAAANDAASGDTGYDSGAGDASPGDAGYDSNATDASPTGDASGGTIDAAAPHDSGLCADGSCGSGCLIDGSFFSPDAANPADPCQFCSPSGSTTSWGSPLTGSRADGGFCCGNGSVYTPQGADNCGACGHSCCGGGCSGSGVCEPFVLASLPGSVTQAYDLAVSGTTAFVSGASSAEDASVIYSVSLDGGSLQLFALNADLPFGLFVGGSTLYAVGLQSITGDPLTGGSVSTLVSIDGSVAGFGVDPGGTNIYWAEMSNDNQMSVWTSPADGGAPLPIWDGGNQPCGGVNMAVTESAAYWTWSSNTSGSNVPVLTAPLGGSTVTTAVSSVLNPVQIAAASGEIYVLSANASSVEAFPLDGGAPLFYDDDAGPIGFWVDPTRLYIADQGGNGGALSVMPLDGGPSVLLDDDAGFTGYSRPPFAVTSQCVYWVSGGAPLVINGIASPTP